MRQDVGEAERLTGRPGEHSDGDGRGLRGHTSPVPVAPGRTAWVKLTFVQVQGEADGYCVSGAEPQSYPTLIVGLPGAGRHQVQLEDGRHVVACDDKVTVTAVSASKPS
ncbi:DUF4232 domain-containing protein [Streptomyces sp. NPDC001514]